MSQIIYDRFKLYQDDKQIAGAMNKLRKEVKSEDIPHQVLNRVLKKHVNFFNNENLTKGALLWQEKR